MSQSPALGFMQVVPQRTAATLLHLIQQHVAPGTVIHSDQWASYNQVGTLPNVSAHRTVNHSVEFVSPSGVHTQNVESYWNRSKMKLKRMRGCAAKEVPSYLDEFMWRERFERILERQWIPLSVTLLSNTLSDFPRYSVLFFFFTGFFQSHHTFKRLHLQTYRWISVAPGINNGMYTINRMGLHNNSHPPSPLLRQLAPNNKSSTPY